MVTKAEYEAMVKQLQEAGCTDEHIRKALGDPPASDNESVRYSYDWLMKTKGPYVD